MRTSGFPSGSASGSKDDIGMLTAFGMWPEANSCGSRTSTTVQALDPTASSKSPKLTTSGSEPAPKRENMFEDMMSPRLRGARLGRHVLRNARRHIDRHAQSFEDSARRYRAANEPALETDALVATRRDRGRFFVLPSREVNPS